MTTTRERLDGIPLPMISDVALRELYGDPRLDGIPPDLLSDRGKLTAFPPTHDLVMDAAHADSMIFVGGPGMCVRAHNSCRCVWGEPEDGVVKDQHFYRDLVLTPGGGDIGSQEDFQWDASLVQALLQNDYDHVACLTENRFQNHPRAERMIHMVNTFYSYQAEMRVRPGKKVQNDLRNSFRFSRTIDPRFLPQWCTTNKVMICGASPWLDDWLEIVRSNPKVRRKLRDEVMVLIADSAIPLFEKHGIHYDGWGCVDPAGAKTHLTENAQGLLFTESTADPGTLDNADKICMALATAGVNRYLPDEAYVYPVHSAPIDNVAQHLYWTVRRWWPHNVEIMVVGCDLAYKEDKCHCDGFSVTDSEKGVDFERREVCRDGVTRKTTMGMLGGRNNWRMLVKDDPRVWNASKQGLEWGRLGDPYKFVMETSSYKRLGPEPPEMGHTHNYDEFLAQVGFLGACAHEQSWNMLRKAFEDCTNAKYVIRMMDELGWITAKSKWRKARRLNNPDRDLRQADREYQQAVRKLVKTGAATVKRIIEEGQRGSLV